jgi:uncharacterized protein YbjT (DUF2867 family)
MEDYLAQRGEIQAGTLTGYDAPTDTKQLIAVDDIGRFVALGFRERDTWLERTTDIAGDRMTAEQVAGVFGQVLGHAVRYEQAQPSRATPPAGPRPQVDIEALRGVLPGLRTLLDWAREVFAGVPAGAAPGR